MIYSVLLALFTTFVILTNTIGNKLFTLYGLTLPVSIVWYPITFLITDIVSEIYGAKKASSLVIIAFCMSVVLLIFSFIGIYLPASPNYTLADDYKNVFAPVWRLLFASMAAYLLAQIIDVKLFHFWKKLTKGKHLWFRNNASTILSQLVDSFTVNFIFLYKNPDVLTINKGENELATIAIISLSLYLVKVMIALIDTPLCYLGVHWIRKIERKETNFR